MTSVRGIRKGFCSGSADGFSGPTADPGGVVGSGEIPGPGSGDSCAIAGGTNWTLAMMIRIIIPILNIN
jgi:hypothetical protein